MTLKRVSMCKDLAWHILGAQDMVDNNNDDDLLCYLKTSSFSMNL